MRILLFERYVRTQTYPILAYAYRRAVVFMFLTHLPAANASYRHKKFKSDVRRGAVGTESETLKTSSKGMGRGCRIPRRLGGLGSVISSPAVSRAEPRPKTGLVAF